MSQIIELGKNLINFLSRYGYIALGISIAFTITKPKWNDFIENW